MAGKKKKASLDAPVDIEDLGKYVSHKESFHNFSGQEVTDIRTNLLTWYDKHKRDLPWRKEWEELGETEKNVRAYQVWVSEIMLQQTRVATVIDYFNRWINKWPTLHALADASLEEVNEMWSGLGYYRRAKLLHSGAQQVVKDYKGLLPSTSKELENISGIGRYTAGAIASIAFNGASPLVDGNVIRVLSRLRAIAGNSKAGSTIQLFWKLAGDLVDPKRPGSFNQGLMELGATVCTATSPQCSTCPVNSSCLGYKLSKKKQITVAKGQKMACDVCSDFDTGILPITDVTTFPLKLAKKGPRPETVVVCIVEQRTEADEKKFLIVRRPDTGLLAGLWEAPSVILESKESEEAEDDDGSDEEDKKPTKKSAKRKNSGDANSFGKISKDAMAEKIDEYLKDELKMVDYEVGQREWVGEVVHVFSHIKQTLHVEHMVVSLGTPLQTKRNDIVSELHIRQELNKDISDLDKYEDPKGKGKGKGGKEKEVRWVDAEEFHKSAVSKQMRKCFDAYEKFLTSGPPMKKPKTVKSKEEVKGQQKLSAFFKAK